MIFGWQRKNQKGMIDMKSRFFAVVAVAFAVAFVALLLVAAIAYPMHIGEPSYYHVARIDCIVAACPCGLAAIGCAIASAHF